MKGDDLSCPKALFFFDYLPLSDIINISYSLSGLCLGIVILHDVPIFNTVGKKKSKVRVSVLCSVSTKKFLIVKVRKKCVFCSNIIG